MKIDTIVLYVVAAFAGLFFLAHLAGMLTLVVATKGLMLPAFALFIGLAALIGAIIRQRLNNREDDYYDQIEK